jgi:hypothetical protein
MLFGGVDIKLCKKREWTKPKIENIKLYNIYSSRDRKHENGNN